MFHFFDLIILVIYFDLWDLVFEISFYVYQFLRIMQSFILYYYKKFIIMVSLLNNENTYLQLC